MGAWSGKGQPPTRRKLKKWREARRKEEIEADREMDAMLAGIERESQRLGIDHMLTGE